MTKNNVVAFDNPAQELKERRSVLECRLLTSDDFDKWKRHPYQRPIQENQKVYDLAEQLKQNGGIIPGVLTLGRLPNDPDTYGVDYQHRVAACGLSGLKEFLAEVRTVEYPNMAELAKDTILLNSRLVNMRPDDVLRALEAGNTALQRLRIQCPFIGYHNVRRASHGSPVLSMSATLRCWNASSTETPSFGGGQPSQALAELLDESDVEMMSAFLLTAFNAWKDDPEYYALWNSLNLTMCMWMFRQLVLRKQEKKSRIVHMTIAEFGKCLNSVSAASDYVAWLPSRKLGDRDRSPCYGRLRTIFLKRITDERSGQRPMFPTPDWYASR